MTTQRSAEQRASVLAVWARCFRAGITGCGLGLCMLVWSAPTLAAPEPPNDSASPPGVFSFIEEETVSTAIRREQPISQAPSNVYVITAEDIRQSGAPDVPTILRRIPGLEVMQVTGADFNVSVRGNSVGKDLFFCDLFFENCDLS